MEIDTSRLGFEDVICLTGSLLLLGSVFLAWYSIGVGMISGWDTTRLSLVPMVAAFIGILVVVATGLGIDFAEEYGVVLAVVGIAALAVIIVRIYVRQTGLTPAYGIYLSMVGAVALLVAGVTKLIRTYVLFVGQR
ncbi:MAG: hypothetical protein KKE56_01135 [Actinobacteria bacterium]|nr:hypothetical protein [Actinomycetota bacterium]